MVQGMGTSRVDKGMEVSRIIMVKCKSHMQRHMVATSNLTRVIAKINNLNKDMDISNLNKDTDISNLNKDTDISNLNKDRDINNLNKDMDMSNLDKDIMVLESNTFNLNKVVLWKWTQHNRPI